MEASVVAKDGAEMVLVPEGKFLFGISDGQLLQLYRNPLSWKKFRTEYLELPPKEISLPSFYLDRYPVTNERYRRFLKETRYRKTPRLLDSTVWGSPNQPVVCVDWDDARAYARWAGKRLPTEAEWEKAARGTDGRIFPWGDEIRGTICNCAESGLDCTTPVGSFPASASPYGVHDMAGNVWEMTADKWGEGSFAMRGGSFLTYLRFCRATARWAPSEKSLKKGPEWLGFRCVFLPS